jgi:hypothetical protein
LSRVPRFYFHVRNGLGFAEDEEGQMLPSVQAAREEAVSGARSMLSSEVCTGTLDLRGRIEVTDEQRHIVLTVPFSDAIHIRTGELPS